MLNSVYYGFILILNALGANIVEITNSDVIRHLTYGNMFIDGGRIIFFWFVKLVASVVDFIEGSFNTIVGIDFTSFVDISQFKGFLYTTSLSLVVIVILGTVVLHLLQMKVDFDYVKWSLFAIVGICLFGYFNTYMNEWKTIGLSGIGEVFNDPDGDGIEKTISERIFYDNSYDMKASIANNNLTKINQRIPLDGLSINEKMSEDDIDGKIVYDVDGNAIVEELYDGVLNTGFNEERYYRYSLDFLELIVLLVVIAFIYILCMVKVAYLGIDWFYNDLYGTLIISTHVSSGEKIKTVYMSVVQNLMALLIVCASVQIFELMVTSILSGNYNWLVKGILILVSGLVSVFGCSSINKGFGVDDGSRFLLSSMFATRLLGRGMSKMKKRLNGFSGSGNGNKVPHINSDGSSQSASSTEDEVPLTNRIGNADKKLGNQDFTEKPMFGGEGMEPYYGSPDIKDTWHEQGKKKVEDRKKRFSKGNELQKEIESRFANSPVNKSVDTKSSVMPAGNGSSSPIASVADEERDMTVDINDANEEKPIVHVDFGKYKPYKQYDEDFHKKGDTSILNPNYRKPKEGLNNSVNSVSTGSTGYRSSSYDKQLPQWYYDQDSVPTSGDVENFDEEELESKLRNLSGTKNVKVPTRQEIETEIARNLRVTPSDRNYFNSLDDKELLDAYNGYYKNTYVNNNPLSYDDETLDKDIDMSSVRTIRTVGHIKQNLKVSEQTEFDSGMSRDMNPSYGLQDIHRNSKVAQKDNMNIYDDQEVVRDMNVSRNISHKVSGNNVDMDPFGLRSFDDFNDVMNEPVNRTIEKTVTRTQEHGIKEVVRVNDLEITNNDREIIDNSKTKITGSKVKSVVERMSRNNDELFDLDNDTMKYGESDLDDKPLTDNSNEDKSDYKSFVKRMKGAYNDVMDKMKGDKD